MILNLKEGLEECATLCIKIEVILKYMNYFMNCFLLSCKKGRNHISSGSSWYAEFRHFSDNFHYIQSLCSSLCSNRYINALKETLWESSSKCNWLCKAFKTVPIGRLQDTIVIKNLAHFIEQPIFRIPNLEYLQWNFCFDFFNDSENTFWGFFEI